MLNMLAIFSNLVCGRHEYVLPRASFKEGFAVQLGEGAGQNTSSTLFFSDVPWLQRAGCLAQSHLSQGSPH